MRRCMCENANCSHPGRDGRINGKRHVDCSREAGLARVEYVGSVCDECARVMPREYVTVDVTGNKVER